MAPRRVAPISAVQRGPRRESAGRMNGYLLAALAIADNFSNEYNDVAEFSRGEIGILTHR
jgi:hypothetical protein